jgi:protein-L-isoaspartate(D-aspartate) O-methyltransferase
MVREQLRGRGVADPAVLDAMERVPRERFVPADRVDDAYADGALPLEHGQAISQPYVVAAMTEALGLADGAPGTARPFVLEVGTGSGYQAAILLAMGARVLTVERIPALAQAAARALADCPGLRAGDPGGAGGGGPAPGRLTCLVGDGVAVAAEHGPFDGIVVTAAAPEVPRALRQALRPGARLVIPVTRGGDSPDGVLRVVERRGEDRYSERTLFAVRFVPLVRGVAGAMEADGAEPDGGR